MLIGKGGWEAPICTSFGSSKSSLFGSLTLKCISILILLFLLAWLATALCSGVAASWLQEELWHWTPATDIMIGKQHLVYQFFRPCVPPPCTGAPETTYVQHQCNVQWQILSADGVGKLCTTCTLCAAHLEHLVYSTNAMYSGKSCQQTMLENYEQHALFVQHTLLCVQCLCTLASCVSRPCWKSKQLCRLWEILGRVNTRKLSEK